MAEPFIYTSKTKLVMRDGVRHAYLGEVPEPFPYGHQGKLREYYHGADGPPVPSTLDHIVAGVGG
ncbi:MAG: hypothetical protein Q7J25_06665 [Vicinamibacterales bacterium]|nr:hypothetical protein [Vicinamibacterales bacterium]